MEIKKILCPTDFSEFSTNAMDWAISMAASHQAELLLLHVVDQLHDFESYLILALTPQEIADKMVQQAKENMRQIVCNLKKDISIETVVKQGKVFVEVVKTAQEQDIDLIVIGSHGRTGLSHALIGSVAEKVSRKAPCPVLIVRGKNTSFEMP